MVNNQPQLFLTNPTGLTVCLEGEIDSLVGIMNELVIQLLTDITSELIELLGISAAPLLVLVFFRIFRIPRLNSLPDMNLEVSVMNASCDAIHGEIQRLLAELVHTYFGHDFVLPANLSYFDLATTVHHSSRVLADLAPIYQSVSTLGMESPEFQQVLALIQNNL